MVKQAEKQVKRNPLAPVLALLLVIGMGAVAYVLSSEVIMKMPQVRGSVLEGGMNPNTARILFAVAIWFPLAAAAYFFVAIVVGKDPEAGNNMPLPTKRKDEKKRR